MPIHPAAHVSPKANIDPTAEIGPGCVVDGPAVIGAGSRLGPHSVVLGEVVMGRDCSIHAHAVIGDVPQDRNYRGGPSRVVLGDEVIVREGATIHRATTEGGATRIGDRCMIMTNAHIAHDCKLAEDVVIVSSALLGGYVEVGRGAVISGSAGIHQHVRVGALAMVGGLAKVVQDVPPYTMVGRDGELIGVNVIGLRRAGYQVASRMRIKAAFRVLYRAGLPRLEAVRLVAERYREEAAEMLEFFEAPSRRGIIGHAEPACEAAAA